MLDKRYSFLENEAYCSRYWQEQGLYAWDPSIDREHTFVVDTPPPTVSGQLHMGHVCSYTQTDFIVRFQRMVGRNIYYPMGFDDNGLPTERLVERLKGIRAHDMDRVAFQKLCQEVIVQVEDRFRALFRALGLSVDWSLEYQTLSPTSCKLSQMSFLDLLGKGELYRDDQPVLWDPGDQTALSQADIEDKSMEGFIYEILFHGEVDQRPLHIATTRPELLQACMALFYHPDDARYQGLANTYALTPMFKKRVPILPDCLVDPNKGTGLVMCCTFGDRTDVIWQKKHNLPVQIILDNKARITLDGPLKGLHVTKACAKIVASLRAQGYLAGEQAILHQVKCAERSGHPIEILMVPQWFIRTLPHKKALLAHADALIWHPCAMKSRLENWIHGLSWDWCISRQRYLGVPVPVWYSKRPGEVGKVLLPTIDQLPVDPYCDLPDGYSREEVEADGDVLDTWATSSISPQLSSHAVSQEYAVDYQRHLKLFPMDLRPQAHEIIRSWAFYTLLKSHLHQQVLPWKHIMIHGWCLAADQSKMSKSKGNIIDPEKVLGQYGADVVRYWAACARLGVDTCYSEHVLKSGKRLVTKLWNVAQFISQHMDYMPAAALDLVLDLEHIDHDIDRWLLHQLELLIEQVESHWVAYAYANVLEALEAFFWNVFCNDFLELIKFRVYRRDESYQGHSALTTLYYVFYRLLQLFAPIVPFITEHLSSVLYSKHGSVHRRGNWPCRNHMVVDHTMIEQVDHLRAIMHDVRKIKAEYQLSVKAPVAVLTIYGIDLAERLVESLKAVIAADRVDFVGHSGDYPGTVVKKQDYTLWVVLDHKG